MRNDKGTKLLLLAGIVIALASAVIAVRSAMLLVSGIRTQGKVVQVIDGRRTSSNSYRTSEYEGLIRYHTRDGGVHEFWRGGPGFKGNKVDVLYLPGHPEIAEIASTRYLLRTPGLVGLFAVPFLLIGGWPMVTRWRYENRRQRLARDGSVLTAVIERVEQKLNVHIFGRHPLVFHAQFTNPLDGGAEMISSQPVWNVSLADAPKAGKKVRLYFDRSSSQRHLLAWDERVDGDI